MEAESFYVLNVIPKEGMNLFIEFMDGTKCTYNVKNLFKEFPKYFDRLINGSREFFEQVHIYSNGYAITWDGIIGIKADELYKNGVRV